MKNSTKFKTAMLFTSLAVAAGATAAAIILQKKREEEVYHEAELKAMDELEQMMREESDCASCSCAEECATPESDYDAFEETSEDVLEEETEENNENL